MRLDLAMVAQSVRRNNKTKETASRESRRDDDTITHQYRTDRPGPVTFQHTQSVSLYVVEVP